MSRLLRSLLPLCLPAALLPLGLSSASAVDADRYRNPLEPTIKAGGTVDSCADPVVLRGRGEEARKWYMYCTTDPLNDQDTEGTDPVVFHPLPMLVSRDLVNWKYKGDALPVKPTWAEADAGIWAPDIVYSRKFDKYYLTFTVTNTKDEVSGAPGCTGDSAIGVATSDSPLGPWDISDEPVVGPRKDPANADPCAFFWTFDPDVLGDSIGGGSTLYYGSYYGGVHATKIVLSADGMQAVGASTPIAIGNRYEGSNVIRRNDWYYYFGSATNCCNGPLTGYSVFAGRSRSPLGPFVDRDGNLLTEGRVGGTPVLSMNGNRWIGLGHNSVFRDFDGQWWTAYHAVDRFDPYFATETGFTKRPVLLDPITWKNGFPSVRAGRWASDKTMPAPAAQPGEESVYRPHPVARQLKGRLLPAYSAGFNREQLGGKWSWIREPEDEDSFGLVDGQFRFDVQKADLTNNPTPELPLASVLVEDAPEGDFVVQTRVTLDLPAEGCCHNYAQAGLLLHGTDDSFIKLVHASIWETRQTEFAKEVPTEPGPGLSRYGNTVIGAPGETTDLRIVKETRGQRTTFTGYTRQEGGHWTRGGTWVHNRLGDDLKIGLVSMALQQEEEFTAHFDHVKVWSLR